MPPGGGGSQLESQRMGRAGLVKGLMGWQGQPGQKNSLSRSLKEAPEKHGTGAHSGTADSLSPVPHPISSPHYQKAILFNREVGSVGCQRWVSEHASQSPLSSRMFGLGSDCLSTRPNGIRCSPGQVWQWCAGGVRRVRRPRCGKSEQWVYTSLKSSHVPSMGFHDICQVFLMHFSFFQIVQIGFLAPVARDHCVAQFLSWTQERVIHTDSG